MSRRVVGLDLSLRHAGIAYSSGVTTTVNPKKLRGPQRWAVIQRDIALEWCNEPPHLAVIEGYAYAAVGSALYQLCELGGLVRWELYQAGVPWLVVTPATLKKYATGNGGANKTAMVIAARELLGFEGTDDNQADALWLRAIGLDLLDEPPCSLPADNRSVLKQLEFPEGVQVVTRSDES